MLYSTSTVRCIACWQLIFYAYHASQMPLCVGSGVPGGTAPYLLEKPCPSWNWEVSCTCEGGGVGGWMSLVRTDHDGFWER